jgi:hypothetical protein
MGEVSAHSQIGRQARRQPEKIKKEKRKKWEKPGKTGPQAFGSSKKV